MDPVAAGFIALVAFAFLIALRRAIRIRRELKELRHFWLGGQALVAIDLETTGLNPRKDAIIEIAAVKFRRGEELDTFQTLVNPQRPIPSVVQNMTRISPKMLQGAPFLDDVKGEFLCFIGESPLLGYNLPFDLAFLRWEMAIDNKGYDVLSLSRRWVRGYRGRRRGRWRLQSVAQTLGIKGKRYHRALDDARTTAQVFERLIGCHL